jgi:hypothetical protein
VTVAATAKQDSTGQLTEALTFGGAKVDAAQRNRLYNNGSVLDAKDWGWRAESGDRRFFFFDVPATPPAGTQFLALTNFAGPAPHDDLDTLIFGRTVNSYQLADGTDAIFAPYALGTVGASQNTNVGAGVWLFSTAFGLSQPRVTTETAHQDDPDDPSTASVKRSFTLAHAGQVTISTALPGNDIDEYVLRDANGDGKFTPDEIIGSSTTGSGDESVELVDPPDGNYQVWVHGFAVSGIPTFPLTLDAPSRGP